jgi:hypothetical protein
MLSTLKRPQLRSKRRTTDVLIIMALLVLCSGVPRSVAQMNPNRISPELLAKTKGTQEPDSLVEVNAADR